MSKHFKIDARAMLTWGRESIKDHSTAILELVKNSYDAGASVVEIEIASRQRDSFIRISDDGVGMSASSLEENWLRLGYSQKREEAFTARGRRKTGEKGVGRISADRLGATLELRSQARQSIAAGLFVDWSLFEQSGQELQSVPVQEIPEPSFLIPRPAQLDRESGTFGPAPKPLSNSQQRTGTQLLIRGLRQQWEPEDLSNVRRMLSLLTPPFKSVVDFQIRLLSDVEPGQPPVIESPLMSMAPVEARLSLTTDGRVRGILAHRAGLNKKRRVETKVDLDIVELVHPRIRRSEQRSASAIAKLLGPVDVTLMFYPQRSETLTALDLRHDELREFLRNNAGVRVYRDGIRVPPYGDQGRPEGDWLALGDRKARNPAGPMRADFRASPYQLVGAVLISRDTNPSLVDASGREGLIEGDAFSMLKQFLYGCLVQLESHYHRIFVQSRADTAAEVPSPRDTIADVRAHLSILSDRLNEAQNSPGSEASIHKRMAPELEATKESLRRAAKSLDELASQATVSRALATIGIAAATFGHETEHEIQGMRSSILAARLFVTNGDPDNDVLEQLDAALTEAERVAAWGAFALGRVRRDKRTRRTVPINEIVHQVLESIRPAFTASSIVVSENLECVRARCFPMDIECVLINFLTNAYYFAKQVRGSREVEVKLTERVHADRRGYELQVGDSGPGVVKEAIESIWDPLFTTKVDEHGKSLGTGLGLALVASIVSDVGGARGVDRDPRLGGARFWVWFPHKGE